MIRKSLLRIMFMFIFCFMEFGFTKDYSAIIKNDNIKTNIKEKTEIIIQHDLKSNTNNLNTYSFLDFKLIIDEKELKDFKVLNQPEMQRFFNDFGKKESNNKYDTVNLYGYCGRFQL